MKLHRTDARLEVNHQVHRRKAAAPMPSPIDLPNTSLDPLPYNRFAHLAAGGDAEPRVTEVIGNRIENRLVSVKAATSAVAAQKIRPTLQALGGRQRLGWPHPDRPHLSRPHLSPLAALGQAQAERRLRPLRRRFEMIARPFRVRMRSRKPWRRLRRRLFG